MDDPTRWLDHLDALTATTPRGPWAWRGKYPQMIINPGAVLVAETYVDPDHPAHVADWICAARTALPALTAALRSVIVLADRMERSEPPDTTPTTSARVARSIRDTITARLAAVTDMRVADTQRLLALADALDGVPADGDEAKLLADAAVLLRRMAEEDTRG